MTFTEANTVEQLILDAVTRKRQAARLTVQEADPKQVHLIRVEAADGDELQIGPRE